MSLNFQRQRLKSIIAPGEIEIDVLDLVTKTFVSQYIQLPSGSILPFAGKYAPSGYLLCNGDEVEKARYPSLFAILGNTYGEAQNGFFRLPNMSNRFIMGTDQQDNVGVAGGKNELILSENQLPEHSFKSSVDILQKPHSHTYKEAVAQTAASGQDFNVFVDSEVKATSEEEIDLAIDITNDTVGKGEAIDITPSHVKMNYIIKI